MTNIKVYKEKMLTHRCKVYKLYIGDTKYSRVEFTQKKGMTIQWFSEVSELSENEEKNLENIYKKFKNTKK